MSRKSLFSFVFLRHCCARIVPLTLFALTVELAECTVSRVFDVPIYLLCPLIFSPCGMCFYVTALGFSMMATVMTVNPLGNDLSSCLHSSCTAPPCPGGHAAVDSISPASSSECYPVMPDWMCVEAKGSLCLSSIALLCMNCSGGLWILELGLQLSQQRQRCCSGYGVGQLPGQQKVSVVCSFRLFGPVRDV